MPDHRRTQPKGVPKSVFILAFIFVAGLGYIAGAYHTQVFSAVAPLFGVKASGELDLSSVQATYRALASNFDGELDDAALIEGANRGLVQAAGDDYTQYLSRSDAEAFDKSLSGNIGGGIGVEIGMRNDRLTILRVLADNPASKAGVVVGDVITSINDEFDGAWTVEDAVTRIRGEVGTTVKLALLRGEEVKEVTITRAEVSNPSVYSSVENGIGLLTITRFDGETGNLARQAARSFKDQGVRGVVVDLRGNGGGYLAASQDVAGIWLDKKVVVSERQGGRVIDELYSSSNPILSGVPTIVLVDGSSASASEIVAGALQEHGAATLLGETTFGKGSVQQLIDLPAGAQLKVTIARWYTPKGKNISETGITPDHVVVRSDEDISTGRDPQLDAAKERLR